MNLSDLIKENPTINLTINGSDLLQFGQDIANHAAKKALSDNQEVLYTRSEAMNKFAICSATLWRWDTLGLIKGKKIGHRKYYADSDIKLLLANK